MTAANTDTQVGDGLPAVLSFVHSTQRVCNALDAYFVERLGHGVTTWRSQWRCPVQFGPVFLTYDGLPTPKSG